MSGRPAGRRTTAVVLAAAILGGLGLVRILYAGIVPLLPPLVTEPVPPLAVALGGLELAAAVGVALVRFWAPPLGIAVAIAELTAVLLSVPATLVRASERGSVDLAAALLVGVVAPLLAVGFVLFVLLRRWPTVD